MKLRPIVVLPCLSLAALLGGCAMPNSSNPTLEINQALVSSDRASLDMTVQNPSDMDVEVGAVLWSLQYGPLPVAEGKWVLGTMIPSKGSYKFSKAVPFTSPALDPAAGHVELSGSMELKTKGNSGDTSLKSAGFVTVQQAKR